MKKQISQLLIKKYVNHTPVLPEFNPNATADWIKRYSNLPWLKLLIELPTTAILNEIQQVKHMMTSHRDQYADHSGWESFCIHGKSYNATREDSYYNNNIVHQWTDEAITYMPLTVNYFKNKWPGIDYRRLRVMRLKPGGYISIHQDGTEKYLSAINIAITQPSDCMFVMEKHGVIPFVPGSAFWLDLSNRHTIFNNSNQDRWHLIVHQNTKLLEFQDLVVNSYNLLYKHQ